MRHGNLNSGHSHRGRHHAAFQNEWSALANIFRVQAQAPVLLDHKTFVSRFKSKPKAATDAELLLDYLLNGNQRSFTKLYYRYKAKMIGYIFRIVHDDDDAKDVLHNAWEKAVLAFNDNQYHEEEVFEYWFRRICYREAKDWNIKKVRLLRGEEHLPETEAKTLSIEQRLMNSKTNGVLHRALKKLDSPEKDIVIMRALEGKSFLLIAEITGLNINTVKTHYFRTIETLKKTAELQ